MSQVISTNIALLNAQCSLNISQRILVISLQRLFVDLRNDSAKDAAAVWCW